MASTPLPIADPAARSRSVRRCGLELGFDLVGIAPAERPAHADSYLDWLERGYDAEMSYLRRPDAIERRLDPSTALVGARSLVMVALNYHQRGDGPVADPSRPVIARYARGEDYHHVFEEKLTALAQHVRRVCGAGIRTKPYVDYGPVLERDHTQRAGLGWIGKNTVLINPELGSYLFLGEVLTDAELEPDAAFLPDHCGTCTRCIEACPTGAIKGPRELDSRLCISYLTIELRGPIPRELRPLIGNRIFGCDICQEVCPWNRHIPETSEPRFRPRDDVTGAELIELMRMSRAEWDVWTRGSAIRRAGYAGFKRNVAVALGNWLGSTEEPPQEPVGVLIEALHDEEPLVRGHAAWGLGRTPFKAARAALSARLRVEPHEQVREEIAAALSSPPSAGATGSTGVNGT
jgi:epoxyqueuosine reductase